jgi:hypothetical protein
MGHGDVVANQLAEIKGRRHARERQELAAGLCVKAIEHIPHSRLVE